MLTLKPPSKMVDQTYERKHDLELIASSIGELSVVQNGSISGGLFGNAKAAKIAGELSYRAWMNSGMNTAQELHVSANEANEAISNVLSTLKEREQTVIILRFGLNNNKTHTLKEIGKLFGCTRERVRQIEKIALGRLRHISRKRALEGFDRAHLDSKPGFLLEALQPVVYGEGVSYKKYKIKRGPHGPHKPHQMMMSRKPVYKSDVEYVNSFFGA
jgi:RNA polymerase sigma factor (sigma-70 family)